MIIRLIDTNISDIVVVQYHNHFLKSNKLNPITKNTLTGNKIKYVGRKMMRRHAEPLIKAFR